MVAFRPSVILCVMIVFVTLICAISPSVFAHSPKAEDSDNDSLDTAYVVQDPLKSWALYWEMHTGKPAQYFAVDMNKGERLKVQLFIPAEEKGRFLPSIYIIGKNITSNPGTPPDHLEIPNGSSLIKIQSVLPEKPGYEPFTPSAYYYLANVDMILNESGRYYLSVYDEKETGGNYGIAVGYLETFTAEEWLLIPYSLISIHQWEGQHIAVILAPFFVTVILGLALINRKWKGALSDTQGASCVLAGLIFIGGAAITLYECAYASYLAPSPAVLVTLFFALSPMALGLVILKTSIGNRGGLGRRQTVVVVVCGIFGLLLWGGLIFGPVMAILSAFIPPAMVTGGIPTVVPKVDLERYSGRWYEIARFPSRAEEGCTNVTATYLIQPDGHISVTNECLRNGEPKKISGVARVVGKKTNAILKVKLFGPFWSDYWIIDLAPDYSWAVVGTPGRSYLWILSRTLKLEDETYEGILERITKQGYDTNRLIKTTHN